MIVVMWTFTGVPYAFKTENEIVLSMNGKTIE